MLIANSKQELQGHFLFQDVAVPVAAQIIKGSTIILAVAEKREIYKSQLAWLLGAFHRPH